VQPYGNIAKIRKETLSANTMKGLCNENQLDAAYLSSVYFVNQLLHVSGIFVAHRQAAYCIQGVPGGM
jgi:hypothetical protein